MPAIRGIKFPIRFVDGSLSYSEGDQRIKESVIQIMQRISLFILLTSFSVTAGEY